MGSPNEPRSWLRDPVLFGKPRKVVWEPPPIGVPDRVAYRAAQIQHAIAARVVVTMPARGFLTQRELHGTDPENLARRGPRLDMTYDRLGKILRGYAPMSLHHIADLEQRLGPLVVGLHVDPSPWPGPK